MRLTLATALLASALTACVTEQGPPPALDPSTPMTTRHLNTSMDCSEWQRNPDGSWTAAKDVTLATPNGQTTVASGTSFRPGSYLMGVDVAYALKRECV